MKKPSIKSGLLAGVLALLPACHYPLEVVAKDVRSVIPSSSLSRRARYDLCNKAELPVGSMVCEDLVDMDDKRAAWIPTAIDFANAGDCEGAKGAMDNLINTETNPDLTSVYRILLKNICGKK